MDFVMTALSPGAKLAPANMSGFGRNMGGLGGREQETPRRARGGSVAHLGLRLIGPLRAPAQQACTHPITQLR